MFGIILVNTLLVNSIVGNNEVHFANSWIPVSGPFLFSQMKTSRIDTSYANGWKSSEDNRGNNYDFIKKDAITIISPVQAHTIHNGSNVYATLPVPSEKVTRTTQFSKESIQNGSKYSANQTTPEKWDESVIFDQERNLSKLKSRDEKLRRIVKPDIPRRTPKQVVNPRLTENLMSSNLELSNATTGAQFIVKNITENSYEVTEPSYVPELSQDTNIVRNVYTTNFVDILSKYGINAQEMLNNYARSKLHQNNMLNVYAPRARFVPLVPLRYNSLNHLPVNPLLAVFLSNYGYYLQGFYGQPNNYKNLYGYSASNNIHNNKPFGAYKVYSDTDSSN